MGKAFISVFFFFLKNYALLYELCDQMRFEVTCAKSDHCVISELKRSMLTKSLFILLFKETMKSGEESIIQSHEELRGINLFLIILFLLYMSRSMKWPWSIVFVYHLGSQGWSIYWFLEVVHRLDS